VTVGKLDDIEEIRQLKYRYFRCLDSKDWEGLADCLAQDCSAAYDSGKYSYQGRDAIMEFLSGSLGSSEIVSLHHGHHPEIELTGSDSARGTWYLEDYLVFVEADARLRGAAFYHDEYRRVDGSWKISRTGYVRTFEESNDGSGWKLNSYGDQLK
jgi:ketosteroid isomerase-like protein